MFLVINIFLGNTIFVISEAKTFFNVLFLQKEFNYKIMFFSNNLYNKLILHYNY